MKSLVPNSEPSESHSDPDHMIAAILLADIERHQLELERLIARHRRDSSNQ